MPPKKRVRCTEEEKRWLREYRAMYPSMKLKEILIQFERRFNRAIESSTASTITLANNPLNRTSTVSGASRCLAVDVIGEVSDPKDIPMETRLGNLQNINQVIEDKAFTQDVQLQSVTIVPEILGRGFSSGPADFMDSAPFHVTHNQYPLNIYLTEPPTLQTYVSGSECLISKAYENGSAESHEQARQAEGAQSSYIQSSLARQLESDEWMYEVTTGVAPSPNISPLLNTTDNFFRDGSSASPPSGYIFPAEQFQDPSPRPFEISGRPQTELPSKFRVRPGISWDKRPTKRRRVREVPRSSSVDIAESVEILQSLHEIGETSLRSSTFDLVFQALRSILVFTTKKYRQEGEKDTSLFKVLINALRNSPSITMQTTKTVPSQNLPSAYQFDQSTDAKQQQNSIVYSCQSPSARIDVIARKRFTESCEVLNREIFTSEVPSTNETKGKQSIREIKEGSTEIDYSTASFIGTVVITPSVGSAQLILNISQKTTLLANTFHVPRISFRLTIPSSSEIFKIAAQGTVFQLRQMLESRAEFWNVCDENGISLIHHAAEGLNIENCAYLLEHISDVDVFEPSHIHYESGILCGVKSMFSFPSANVSDLNRNGREKIATWCTMLFKKGADPSLYMYKFDDDANPSIFEDVLHSYELETLRDMLNCGTPFIDPNSSVSIGQLKNQSPLLLVASRFAHPYSSTLEAAEKIILLLERGADVNVKRSDGLTCLHIILGYRNYRRMLDDEYCIHRRQLYQKQRKADAEKVLIALVKAGADIYARIYSEQTVSELAHYHGRTKLWMKVLKTCGYDHWNVLAESGLNIECKNCFPELDWDEKSENETDDEWDTYSDEDSVDYESEDELDMDDDEDSVDGKTEDELEMDEQEKESGEDESDLSTDYNDEADSDEEL